MEVIDGNLYGRDVLYFCGFMNLGINPTFSCTKFVAKNGELFSNFSGVT